MMTTTTPEDLAVVVTRENFHEAGRLLGARDCWGLHAPTPSIHLWNADGQITHVYIGDMAVRLRGRVAVIRRPETDPAIVFVGRVVR